MLDTINFILSRYYSKLTDLQHSHDIIKDYDMTEEGMENFKREEIEIKVYSEIIYDMENIKTELESFLK